MMSDDLRIYVVGCLTGKNAIQIARTFVGRRRIVNVFTALLQLLDILGGAE
jgi:hypothetical protein